MVFTGIATRRPGDLSFTSDHRALALARPEQAGVPVIDLWVARGDRIQALTAVSDQMCSLFRIVIMTSTESPMEYWLGRRRRWPQLAAMALEI